MTRYAIYFAPQPGSAWAAAGGSWLGRDVAKCEEFSQERIVGIPPLLLAKLTADARRYGFHATLKAPFHLAEGYTEEHLQAMARAFCDTQTSFILHTPQVRPIADFLALRPDPADEHTATLAMRCVNYFDLLRAAPNESELTKRRVRGLSPRQETLLQRWGYPYTEEEYRFHMTLTDDLSTVDDDVVYDLRKAAERHFAELIATTPLTVDAITIFREEQQGAPFLAWKCFPFGDHLQQASLPASGRLFYFVGPSGAGKDALLQWVQERVPNRDNFLFARRTITRAQHDGDLHEGVDHSTFWRLAAAGQFSMIWEVNGVCYGVRRGIEAELKAGRDVIVNGSREYVPKLQQIFPQAQVIWLEADEAVLQERLIARGRESGPALLRRISRASQFAPPESRQVIRIDNSGQLETAGLEILGLLSRR
jgi:ribose 1,5-bisphosphokinase